MVYNANRITLKEEEIIVASADLLDELTLIPLYDLSAKKQCIARHIQEIQKKIGRKIFECDYDNSDIKSMIYAELALGV
jgi:hypothetical protein